MEMGFLWQSGMRFLGKSKKNVIPGKMVRFYREMRDSGHMQLLYSYANSFQDYILYKGSNAMIAVDKPDRKDFISAFEIVTVPESYWLVVSQELGDRGLEVPKGILNAALEYISASDFKLDSNLPMIDKFPAGPPPHEQLISFMIPVKWAV